MMTKLKAPSVRSAKSGSFVMTRSAISKLNAVEGIQTSSSSRRIFAELDQRGASAEERRRTVVAKYAKKG